MFTFYLIGYFVCFVLILLFGLLLLAQDDKKEFNIFDLLMALVILPFFSWLLLFIFDVIVTFYNSLKREE